MSTLTAYKHELFNKLDLELVASTTKLNSSNHRHFRKLTLLPELPLLYYMTNIWLAVSE